MRFAVFGDIHANLEALEAVLAGGVVLLYGAKVTGVGLLLGREETLRRLDSALARLAG